MPKKLNHCKKYRVYGIINVVAHVLKKDYPTHISAKVVSSVKGLFVLKSNFSKFLQAWFFNPNVYVSLSALFTAAMSLIPNILLYTRTKIKLSMKISLTRWKSSFQSNFQVSICEYFFYLINNHIKFCNFLYPYNWKRAIYPCGSFVTDFFITPFYLKGCYDALKDKLLSLKPWIIGGVVLLEVIKNFSKWTWWNKQNISKGNQQKQSLVTFFSPKWKRDEGKLRCKADI